MEIIFYCSECKKELDVLLNNKSVYVDPCNCDDRLNKRKNQIEGILKLLCDSENQPHQFMDDWEEVYDRMFFTESQARMFDE